MHTYLVTSKRLVFKQQFPWLRNMKNFHVPNRILSTFSRTGLACFGETGKEEVPQAGKERACEINKICQERFSELSFSPSSSGGGDANSAVSSSAGDEAKVKAAFDKAIVVASRSGLIVLCLRRSAMN
jgi:hypothetical protein